MVLLVAGCAGDRAYKEGKALIDNGQIENGLAKLEEATREDPNNAQYRIALTNSRIGAINRLLHSANGAFADGKFPEAESLYSLALNLDKENSRAKAGLNQVAQARKHNDLFVAAHNNFAASDLEAAEEKIRLILMENPNHREAKSLAGKIDALRVKSKLASPTLRPYRKPITLEFRDADIKAVFSILSNTTKINFFIDKDLRSEQKISIFVKQVTLDRALSLLLEANQLAMKIIDDNTALIYANTPQKNQEYQNLMVKTFYLANAEAKQVVNSLRTILKIKDVIVDERLNLLVVRAAPETIKLAEKLIAAQDLAEPEVLLEVSVVEVKRSRMLNLGIQYPLQFGVVNPSTTLPLTVDALRNLTGATTSISPSPSVNMSSDISDANILANPSIRVRNRDKAKIHIGERVPVVTSASNQTSPGYISETVQYVDAGIKLEVEPNIYLDGDVAIKVSLEVSSIGAKTKTANGSEVYRIGTRSAATMLRLQDGETQLLAGLINDEDRSSNNGLPGLGELPLIGRLFSNQQDERQKTEIVLSITPHLVRNVNRPNADVIQFWSGTENNVGMGVGELPPLPVVSSVAPKSPDIPVAPPMPASPSIPAPQPLPPASSDILVPLPPLPPATL